MHMAKLYKPDELSSSHWQLWLETAQKDKRFASPFYHPQFTKVVARQRDDVRILVIEDSNAPLALWPLHLRHGGVARNIGVPFADYQGPVLFSDQTLKWRSEISAAGINSLPFWAFPKTLSTLISETDGFHILEEAPAHIVDLTEGVETFLEAQAKISKQFYKNLRRRKRNLEKDHGSYDVMVSDKPHDALNALIKAKSKQFAETGTHNVLAAPWVQSLFHDFLDCDEDNFKYVIYQLRLGEHDIAYESMYEHGAYAHSNWVTYDREFYKYSPGHILFEGLLHIEATQNYDYINLGVGMADYKGNFANMTENTISGIATTPAGLGSLKTLVRAPWLALEEANIKALSTLARRLRRRLDYVATSELTAMGRAKGVARMIGG